MNSPIFATVGLVDDPINVWIFQKDARGSITLKIVPSYRNPLPQCEVGHVYCQEFKATSWSTTDHYQIVSSCYLCQMKVHCCRVAING